MRRASRTRDYRRILVVRFSSLGDIVLTTPVLMALEERYPRARIDYLLKEQYAPLLENHPSGCGIVVLREDVRRDSGTYLRFCDDLKGKGYDLIVDLQGNGRSLVLRRRVFGDYVKVHKGTVGRLLLVKFGRGRDKYPDIRRKFLKTIARLNIEWDRVPARAVLGSTDSEKLSAVEKFFSEVKRMDRLIAVHPGSRWPLKNWGDERYNKLVRELLSRGYEVLVLGERQDSFPKTCIFAGETSLRELISLIALSAVFVGNDSGPLHIAEGVGTPSVGILGPTHPSLGYAPAHAGSRILGVELDCRPCTLFGSGKCRKESQLCMEGVTPQQVAEAVEDLFNGGEDR